MGFGAVATNLVPILKARRRVRQHVATAGVDLVVEIPKYTINMVSEHH